MTSGGARARSGPPADPNALRRDRKDDAASWLVLPAERTGPTPDWPLSVAALPAELVHWERAWRTPQATEWERNGLEVEVALYVRSLAEAEIPGAAANLRNLVKQLQENLGISYIGLTKHRWKIPAAPAATAPTQSPAARPARGRSSSRDRLKVVAPPSE